MTALDPEASALVASEVAALRRAGWPSGKALELVASGLPPGAARARLTEVASSLEQARPVTGDDPLVAMLALGERAGADALDEAAAAALADLEARQSFWSTFAPGVGFVAFCLALLGAAGWIGRSYVALYEMTGLRSPASLAALALLSSMRFVGPIAAVLLLAAAPRLARRWALGAKLHGAAASLRRFAALLDAGVPEAEAASWIGTPPGIPPRFARFADWLSADAGRAVAARTLAEELELIARARDRLASALLPALGFVAFALFVLPLFLVAFVFPIFSIAGAVR